MTATCPSARAPGRVLARSRCSWCGDDPLYVRYHDTEWGRPLRNDERLFEMLCLEGAQAGLSWITVLRKREGYRRAFAGFDPVKVARFGQKRRAALMQDAGIVRNRLKIAACVTNAKAYLELRKSEGSFARYLWGFAPAVHRRPRGPGDIRATTPESDAMSKDLRKRGFKFVGSTICYAFMQAVGIVDDHQVHCFVAKRRR